MSLRFGIDQVVELPSIAQSYSYRFTISKVLKSKYPRLEFLINHFLHDPRDTTNDIQKKKKRLIRHSEPNKPKYHLISVIFIQLSNDNQIRILVYRYTQNDMMNI